MDRERANRLACLPDSDHAVTTTTHPKDQQVSAHIIDGEFQSDKYPTCPRGKVPLSVKDQTAQDLLWEYAQRRRVIDAEFSDDLETALVSAGHLPIAKAKTNVVIEVEQFDDYRGRAELRLRVDGDLIDTGSFGGEPEDNLEYRDYAWVKGMLERLATRLGAHVTIERKP